MAKIATKGSQILGQWAIETPTGQVRLVATATQKRGRLLLGEKEAGRGFRYRVIWRGPRDKTMDAANVVYRKLTGVKEGEMQEKKQAKVAGQAKDKKEVEMAKKGPAQKGQDKKAEKKQRELKVLAAKKVESTRDVFKLAEDLAERVTEAKVKVVLEEGAVKVYEDKDGMAVEAPDDVRKRKPYWVRVLALGLGLKTDTRRGWAQRAAYGIVKLVSK